MTSDAAETDGSPPALAPSAAPEGALTGWTWGPLGQRSDGGRRPLLLPTVATPSSAGPGGRRGPLPRPMGRVRERWWSAATSSPRSAAPRPAEPGRGNRAGGHDALAAHDRPVAEAIRRFTECADRRLIVLPGWRDPEVAEDPDVVTEVYGLGAEVAPAVDLRLATAAGGAPGAPWCGPAARWPAPSTWPTPTAAWRETPWLAGIDRLEQPGATARFVTSRTLYRRLGRFVWVPPPLLAVVVALLVRLTFVYHGVYHLVHQASAPRRALVRAYTATWTSRFLVTLTVVVVLELAAGRGGGRGLAPGVASQRRRSPAGALGAPSVVRAVGRGADETPPSAGLEVCGSPRPSTRRATLVAAGADRARDRRRSAGRAHPSRGRGSSPVPGGPPRWCGSTRGGSACRPSSSTTARPAGSNWRPAPTSTCASCWPTPTCPARRPSNGSPPATTW